MPIAWPVPRSLTLVATAGLMSTQSSSPRGQHIAGGDGVQHRSQAQHYSRAAQMLIISVLGLVHVGDGIGQRAVVTQTAASTNEPY